MQTPTFGTPQTENTPVLYALVRFRPFAETEEFANVGVLVFCPKLNLLDYRMVDLRAKRVPNFFDRFDHTLYKNIIRKFDEALHYFVETHRHASPANQRHAFEAFIHPREAAITMSTYRVVMSRDPKNELDNLFEHYVRQNFDTRLSAEKQVENNTKVIIQSTGRRFYQKTIGNNGFHVTFPFVQSHGDAIHKVIKPLYLGHDKLSDVYAHGDIWTGKMKRIRNQLPDLTLVAIDGRVHPSAIEEISDELKNQNLIVHPYTPEVIRHFALQ